MILACLILAGALCHPSPPPEVWATHERVGCTASLIPDPDKRNARWHVRVWVAYTTDGSEHVWSALYSMRDQHERRRALQDCDDWLECLRKRSEEKPSP